MQRDRAYHRKVRKRTIRKKCTLLKRLGGGDPSYYDGWTRNQPGRLAKGKIHCSCWMCRTTSYDFLSHRDKKENLDAQQQLKELYILWNNVRRK